MERRGEETNGSGRRGQHRVVDHLLKQWGEERERERERGHLQVTNNAMPQLVISTVIIVLHQLP